jgi:hypothetical protein
MSDLGTSPLASGDVVAAARAIVDQAEFMCTRSVAVFGSDVCREDGFANVSDWMLANTNARSGEGARRGRDAELLAKLPSWSDAASSGAIGYVQVQAMSSVMTRKRLPFALRDEAILLDAAKQFTTSEFREIVARWVALCDDRYRTRI